MALTIKQFSDILKKKLPTDKYTIKGEIRQPKISNGHLYMILKDEFSKLDCIVWKSKKTNAISELKDGDMVEVVGIVDYYVPTGSLKFIIDTVSISNTIGDMYNIFKKCNYDEDHFEIYLRNNLGLYSNFYINNIKKQIKAINYLQN